MKSTEGYKMSLCYILENRNLSCNKDWCALRFMQLQLKMIPMPTCVCVEQGK